MFSSCRQVVERDVYKTELGERGEKRPEESDVKPSMSTGNSEFTYLARLIAEQYDGLKKELSYLREAVSVLSKESLERKKEVEELQKEQREGRISDPGRNGLGRSPESPRAAMRSSEEGDYSIPFRPNHTGTEFIMEKPIFHGDSIEHPIQFIREVESYFKLNMIPPQVRVSLVLQMLRGDAKTWGRTLFPIPEAFSDFREKFLSFYWDLSAQCSFKLSIVSGYYHAERDGNMQRYFLGKVADSRLCVPPLPEEELIYAVIRHFPANIQNLLYCAQPPTIEKMHRLLGQFTRPTPRPEFYRREPAVRFMSAPSRRSNNQNSNNLRERNGERSRIFVRSTAENTSLPQNPASHISSSLPSYVNQPSPLTPLPTFQLSASSPSLPNPPVPSTTSNFSHSIDPHTILHIDAPSYQGSPPPGN